MRRYISPLCLLFLAALLFASCLSTDEEEVTLYDDIAITEFQVTSAKIYKHTTSSTGVDSVYVVTDETVADYPFYIDQLRGTIYNVDSLPQGTDARTLLCSYSTKNNGMVYIENASRDSMKSFQTTDSTDFTLPRYARVYASDARSYRSYQISVNVHKENADSFQWKRLADNSSIASLGSMRAVNLTGRILVLGKEGNNTVIYSTGAADGNSWEKAAVAFGSEAYNNVVVKNDTLFVLDNGTLKITKDGTTFTDFAAATDIKQLVGGCTTELYAINNNNTLLVSPDGGKTWQADVIDEDASLLPTRDITYSYSAFKGNENTDYVILAGNRSVDTYPSDSTAAVWRKIVDYSGESRVGKWAYMDVDDTNLYPLPRLSALTVFNYGSSVLAFGGAGIGSCHKTPYSQIYESRDGGITWKNNSAYAFPKGFDAGATTSCAAVTDGSNNIWIVCGGTGQVWRGKLNGMAWNK